MSLRTVLVSRRSEKPLALEVTDDTAIEKAIRTLVSKYRLTPGPYDLIHRGKALKNPHPFAGLSDHPGQIILFPRPPPIPRIENLPVGQAASQDWRQDLDLFMERAHIETLYSPAEHFMAHAAECAAFSEVAGTLAGRRIATREIERAHHEPIQFLAVSPNVVLSLCGVAAFGADVVDELAIKIGCLSHQQKTAFQRLLRFGRGAEATYTLFERLGFDEGAVERELSIGM
jgi:hypothetical protein